MPEADAAEGSPVPLYSVRAMAFFELAFKRYFAGSFQALRVPHWGLPDFPTGRPLIALANHPSWWDGVMFMLLLRRFFPDRPAFIPMDAAALQNYRFMRRLGVFGVEQETARGSVRFLRTAKEVLADPNHMLWMNAPGRFADVRERPVPLAPGVVRLPEIAPEALLVPLAFEYTHWTERRGEALAAFGPPMLAAELLALDREARAAHIRAAITANCDRLAADVLTRDPARFTVAVAGRTGMGGVYEIVQYLRALLRGERFDPRHDRRAEAG